MHATSVVTKDRLGHKCSCFSVEVGNIFNDVLISTHVVSHFEEGVETKVNPGLARSSYFVVLAFNIEAELCHDKGHFVTKIH